MNVGPNTIGYIGVSNYTVAVSAAQAVQRIIGVEIDWDNIDPIEGNNETVTLTIDATGGDYTVSYGGQTTAAIAEAATAATLETALEGLSSIGAGNVLVSGSAGGPYTIEFVEDLRHANATAITTNAAGLTGGAGTAVVAVTAQGAADASETLASGTVVAAGEKVIPAGTIIYKSGGKYIPAPNGATLVRGECYIALRDIFQAFTTEPMAGEVSDNCTVFLDRLLLGNPHVTEAAFLTAFPGVQVVRD